MLTAGMLALILLLSACLPSAQATPLTLAMVHSNDTWGYLDPCG
jgi:hypothetical protein